MTSVGIFHRSALHELSLTFDTIRNSRDKQFSHGGEANNKNDGGSSSSSSVVSSESEDDDMDEEVRRRVYNT